MSQETTASAADLPAEVRGWIGQKRYEQEGEFDVERGYVFTTCASVENGNPLFWDEKAAQRDHRRLDRAADHDLGLVPPALLGAGPHASSAQPLQVHFDLKEKLGLPEAVMTDNTIVFREPVRPGDRLRTWQVLRSVSRAEDAPSSASAASG